MVNGISRIVLFFLIIFVASSVTSEDTSPTDVPVPESRAVHNNKEILLRVLTDQRNIASDTRVNYFKEGDPFGKGLVARFLGFEDDFLLNSLLIDEFRELQNPIADLHPSDKEIIATLRNN